MNETINKAELVALLKEAVAEAVEAHPLSSEEIQWVRLAIKAEADRAAFRKAVIEKTLLTLVVSALGWLGYWLLDVFQTYFNHKQ